MKFFGLEGAASRWNYVNQVLLEAREADRWGLGFHHDGFGCESSFGSCLVKFMNERLQAIWMSFYMGLGQAPVGIPGAYRYKRS